MADPLVSIIVPSYNQGSFIRRTLDSILDQEYRPLEVWVIDGGSQDGTVDVLKEYDKVPEVHWVSEPDRGPADAVNKGFSRARGEIAAVQSSDDYYLPGAIRSAVDELEGAPELGLVYAGYIRVDAQGRELFPNPAGRYSLGRLLAGGTSISQSAAFFRLALARELGGWDERIPYVPDTDLWYRMAFCAGVKSCGGFWSCARAHPHQRDQQKEKIHRDYRLMLRQMRELRASSWYLRRAAQAGERLIGLRYSAGRSDWEITKALWSAIAYYPGSIFFDNVPKHRLIPGYFWMARQAGRLKALLRFGDSE